MTNIETNTNTFREHLQNYPRDLCLRHWLQFWQLRTWIHDNLCYLTIKSDTGQHSQFLRCLFPSCNYEYATCSRNFCTFSSGEAAEQSPPLTLPIGPPIRLSPLPSSIYEMMLSWNKNILLETCVSSRMPSEWSVGWSLAKVSKISYPRSTPDGSRHYKTLKWINRNNFLATLVTLHFTPVGKSVTGSVGHSFELG